MAVLKHTQSLRFNDEQIEKLYWLKSRNFNPDQFVRNAFDAEFNRQFKRIFKSNIPAPF
jgi:hypothetical protein